MDYGSPVLPPALWYCHSAPGSRTCCALHRGNKCRATPSCYRHLDYCRGYDRHDARSVPIDSGDRIPAHNGRRSTGRSSMRARDNLAPVWRCTRVAQRALVRNFSFGTLPLCPQPGQSCLQGGRGRRTGQDGLYCHRKSAGSGARVCCHHSM